MRAIFPCAKHRSPFGNGPLRRAETQGNPDFGDDYPDTIRGDSQVATRAGETGMAARYALALFELADEQQKLDAVADDLKAFAAAIDENEELRRMMASPVIGRAVQGQVIGEILKRSQADDLTQRFICVAAENRRLYALSGIIKAYIAELAKRRGEVAAEVTSARALSEEQSRAVEDALQKVEGRNVTLSLKVDPQLIGGMVVKVGSRMVDSSLRTQIDRMKLVMKGAG
ncbi:MAG: ATP synthase subunit delta [Alphaproteobacteria bacterium MarineAlpha4_Bin2]|nr:MAG: ATP synthase subunit delta [Alphaproteobacteria bacterium MarineAlpha4_Bin2]